MNKFGVDIKDDEELSCRWMAPYSENSAGVTYSFLDPATCEPSIWASEYTIFTRDDFKRCSCDKYCEGKLNCKPKDYCKDAPGQE